MSPSENFLKDALRHEEHPACKKVGCWFVGDDDLTGALQVKHHFHHS